LILKDAKLRPEFELLKSIPGIGQTLALTIMYETGSIARFADAGHFCSYCRCVPSKHLSNGKVQGKGNVRNATLISLGPSPSGALCHPLQPLAKRFYERKKAKTHAMVALRAISHKLARASFYHPARPSAVSVLSSLRLIPVEGREPVKATGRLQFL